MLKKGGIQDNIASYRPISVTNNICRIFEKIIFNRLTEYLENGNLLSPNQHGFRKYKSTLTNLVDTYNYVTQNLDLKNSVDVIYLDFEKAFDKVDHFLLLKKLNLYKIPPYISSWISNFFLNRIQAVRIRKACSNSLPVTSGVPQGSVLGPLLFVVYINDMFDITLYSKIISFADDTKILGLSKNRAFTQLDLNKIFDWCSQNNVSINFKKTVVMRFGTDNGDLSYVLDGNDLQVVTKTKDLGIIVDNKLKFSEHCFEVLKKCNYISYSIRRLFSKRTPKQYFELFKLYVRPIIDYSIVFWFPTYEKYIKIVENIQKRFTKHICPRGLGYLERLKLLSDSTIEKRFSIFSCHFVYKCFHHLIHSDFVFYPATSTVTRGHSKKLLIPYVRSPTRKSFCTIRSIAKWNALSNSVVTSSSFQAFKRALVCHHTPELRA